MDELDEAIEVFCRNLWTKDTLLALQNTDKRKYEKLI